MYLKETKPVLAYGENNTKTFSNNGVRSIHQIKKGTYTFALQMHCLCVTKSIKFLNLS